MGAPAAPRPTLRTERLTLRPLEAGDVPALVVALDDYNLSGWLTQVPFPYTEADARAFTAACAAADPFEGYGVFDAKGLVGGIGIGADASLGYWIAWDAQGRGYATEAARAFVGHWFAATGAAALASGHFEGNIPSRHVLEKLGFVPDGQARVFSRAQGIEMTLERMRLERAAWEARGGD